ncbi:MAG: 50S ribosomal protein L25 [Parcubacteria group bacterium]|nr:MAG: 50S ribosomal protein L25 [Parcubacteria group bacterium]
MSHFTLEAKKREIGKHSLLTNIIKNNRVAAVVYGLDTEPITIDVDYNQLLKVMKGAGTSHIIDLKVDGHNFMTIVRGYQQDPVSDKLRHVDFLAVSKDKPFTTMVPIELVGVSKAVKEQGAKLSIKNQWVKVKCLPENLPSKYVIDLSSLAEIGQGVLIGDIETKLGVQVLNDPRDPVVSVVVPKEFKIEEPTAAAATTEVVPGADAGTEAAPAEGAEAPKDSKAEAAPADTKKK